MDAIRLQSVLPKLPMKDLPATRSFYRDTLGFRVLGEYDRNYLMVGWDPVEIHLFLHPGLRAEANYGMCYIRLDGDIGELYHRYWSAGVIFTDLGHLEKKLWGQWEFSIVDPDHNLITFGQASRIAVA